MANKYHAERCPCDVGGEHHWHGSRGERARCWTLEQQQRLGLIRDLRRHTTWPLLVNEQQVGVFTDDHSYYRADGTFVVEDFKATPTRTEAYRLRRKMFRAQYGFDITETQ